MCVGGWSKDKEEVHVFILRALAYTMSHHLQASLDVETEESIIRPVNRNLNMMPLWQVMLSRRAYLIWGSCGCHIDIPKLVCKDGMLSTAGKCGGTDLFGALPAHEVLNIFSCSNQS